MERPHIYKEAKAHLRGLSPTEIRSLAHEVLNEKYLERPHARTPERATTRRSA